jgi:hypothetical protein
MLFVRHDGTDIESNIDEIGKRLVCPCARGVGLGVRDEEGVEPEDQGGYECLADAEEF